MSKDADFRNPFIEALRIHYEIWRTRPTRKRDWHVFCTFGGAKMTLRGVREKDLLAKLAPNYRILYIDSAHGLVFVDDGTMPRAAKVNSL